MVIDFLFVIIFEIIVTNWSKIFCKIQKLVNFVIILSQ